MKTVTLLAVFILLAGCSQDRSTDTVSDASATVAEKQAFLEKYLKFRRSYDDLHFNIMYRDGGSGMVPSPSEWDTRVFATVPDSEIEQWIDGLNPAKGPDVDWVSDIPNAPTDLSNLEWYEADHRTVGIDREQQFVLYRNYAN